MRRLLVAPVGASLVLLLAAWVPATQPFGGPDEASHYLRALSITHGQLVGPKIPYPNVALTPAQQAFVNHDTTAVRVSRRLSPPDVQCIDGKPDLESSTEASPTGDYYPVAYLLPSVALAVASDASTGQWLTRVSSVLPCIAFVVLAVALVWSGTAWSLLGLLVALTPMTLFVSAILNPSGLETAACAAFAAAVLRLTRARPRSQPWEWAALAVSGAVAILAWQAGPGFVVADLAVGSVLLGRTGLRELSAAHGRELRGASGAPRRCRHVRITDRAPSQLGLLELVTARFGARGRGRLARQPPGEATRGCNPRAGAGVPGPLLRVDLPVQRIRDAGPPSATGAHADPARGRRGDPPSAPVGYRGCRLRACCLVPRSH